MIQSIIQCNLLLHDLCSYGNASCHEFLCKFNAFELVYSYIVYHRINLKKFMLQVQSHIKNFKLKGSTVQYLLHTKDEENNIHDQK